MSWRVHGMRTWMLQRLTALYMILYLLSFGLYIASLPITGFADWRACFSSPVSNIATLLFFFALMFHAWVGVRDILIDYVKLSSLRLILWTLITLGLIALAIWVSMILFSVVEM